MVKDDGKMGGKWNLAISSKVHQGELQWTDEKDKKSVPSFAGV